MTCCLVDAQAEFLLSRLHQMKERIDDAEDLLNLELDQRCVCVIRVWVGLHAPYTPNLELDQRCVGLPAARATCVCPTP